MDSRSVRTISRLVVLALVSAAVLAAVPAFAYDVPVPNDCTVNGVQLQGLSDAEARATITSESVVPTLAPIAFTAGGRPFTFAPVLALDVDTMLASAYDTATPFSGEIAPRYTLASPSVTTWVSSTATGSYRGAVNAAYYLNPTKTWLRVRKSSTGFKLNQTGAATTVRSAVASAIAGSELTTIALPGTVLKPSITGANMGKAIFVDLSQRKLRVFKVKNVIRTYRIAVGMPGYATPTGTFRIIRKVQNPTWYNPGSAWAKNMPAYIGPGPTNPLGTRALYLNTPGIRIHGTSKRSSIGTAASHGCMRMLRENIEALYPLIPVGTPVYIVK